jgi:hypothetical protein
MGEHIFFVEELFMTKGKKFFLGMAALLGVSLFLVGCETEVEVPGEKVEVSVNPVPPNAVGASTEAILRGLLASDVTVPIAYTGGAPTADLVIPEGKTVYLAGSAITLLAHLAVEADATLVLASDLTTDGTGKLLLVNGTVKVGLNGTLVYGATGGPAEVTSYTVSAGTLTPGSATVIGNTAKVQVLANGTLTLAAGDVVATQTAGKFTLDEAWAAAGAGDLVITGTTSLFTVSELAGKATATRRIMATTDKTDALPNLIPETAAITATGAIISVGEGSNHALTVNGELTLNTGAATLADATSITVGPGGSFTANDAATELEAVTAITVGVNGYFSASSATGAAAGVKVVVDQLGRATLGTVDKLLASSSVGTAGSFTATEVTAFDTSATLAVGKVATVNGVTFPGTTTVSAIASANALTIGDLTVPAGAVFAVPANKNLTVAAGATLTVTGDVNVVALGTLTLTGAASNGGAQITGAGKVAVGNVSITGGANSGAWQAEGAGTSIALSSSASATVTMTGTGTTPQLLGLTDDGALITLAVGHTDGNGAELTVNNVTIDLTAKGGIVFPYVATTEATLVLQGGTATLGALKLGIGNTVNTYANLTSGGHSVAITGSSHIANGASNSDGAAAGIISGGSASPANDATITGQASSYDVTVKAGATLANSSS